MTKGWGRNTDTNALDYVWDLKHGFSVRELSKKYGVMRPTIKS